ncbi:flagellar biosynthesis protein FlhF [Defluviitalea phaphyphila]|uniref:flagellar biosynthesis protein FlhF n=1 Tax=Defluviitalea phaphyphila TaxID=1473580 RepID=UPI00072FAEDF|nr:flagellar biosynthesis protein FlhF [Defluviitalea phaphyphila]
MKIKKYQAETEFQAMKKAKKDLGEEAIILNVKKTNPKGILKWFKKPLVEITAALDEEKSSNFANTLNNISSKKVHINNLSENIIKEQSTTIKSLENKLDNLEELIIKIAERENKLNIDDKNNNKENIYDNPVLQLFYDNLIKNEVTPELAKTILKELNQTYKNNQNDIDNLVRIVYNQIIEIIGEPKPIQIDDTPKIVFFIGPTGVGKTTTIAKITAHFSLNMKKKVGLITADTYRIAAVEQLKTYAEILNVPVEVIYSSEELLETLKKMEEKDIILIDTAGRSHKNEKQFQELHDLLDKVDKKEVFLVLSATTKYRDMLKIISKYSSISDYNIIFTKIDETTALGSILNIKYVTNKNLSYMTFGQNVPDDIEVISPEKIAKMLLGRIDE